MDPTKMEQILEQQLKLMQLLTQNMSSSQNSSLPPSVDGIANSISDFHFDLNSNMTFDTWFRRYEDLFRVDFAGQDDAWKVRVLLRKLGPAELDKYCNLILPKNPRDRSFDETIQTLSQQFGDHSSLFNTRYHCLKMVMNDADDFLTHIGKVNRECERFKLKSLTEDQFKSLIFICSLQSHRFTDVRTRLLSRLEQDPSMTLQVIADEYHRLSNLQQDTALVQHGEQGVLAINAVHKHKSGIQQSRPMRSHNSSTQYSAHSTHDPRRKPPSACWHCGGWHFAKLCPYKKHRCQTCNRVGHKDGFCPPSTANGGPVSASAQRATQNRSPAKSMSLYSTSQVKLPGQRKYVSICLNGYSVQLQLDTASDISIISESLWHKLGSPTLQKTSQTVISACGGMVKLSGQLQCCVSFRGKSFNGTCYVSRNDRNLLGLDWFEQLGLSDLPLNAICQQLQPSDSPDHLTSTASSPATATDSSTRPDHAKRWFTPTSNFRQLTSLSTNPRGIPNRYTRHTNATDVRLPKTNTKPQSGVALVTTPISSMSIGKQRKGIHETPPQGPPQHDHSLSSGGDQCPISITATLPNNEFVHLSPIRRSGTAGSASPSKVTVSTRSSVLPPKKRYKFGIDIATEAYTVSGAPLPTLPAVTTNNDTINVHAQQVAHISAPLSVTSTSVTALPPESLDTGLAADRLQNTSLVKRGQCGSSTNRLSTSTPTTTSDVVLSQSITATGRQATSTRRCKPIQSFQIDPGWNAIDFSKKGEVLGSRTDQYIM